MSLPASNFAGPLRTRLPESQSGKRPSVGSPSRTTSASSVRKPAACSGAPSGANSSILFDIVHSMNLSSAKIRPVRFLYRHLQPLALIRSCGIASPSSSSDWLWPVSLLPERKRQFRQPSLDPIGLDVQNPGRRSPARPRPPQGQALVGAALGIGMRQNVLAADLVVQGIEAIAGFRLRFRV